MRLAQFTPGTGRQKYQPWRTSLMQLRIQWKQGPKPILSQRRTSSCPAWCSNGADLVKLAKGKIEVKSRKTGSWYSAFLRQERPGRLHTSECNHATTMEPSKTSVSWHRSQWFQDGECGVYSRNSGDVIYLLPRIIERFTAT